MKIDLTGRVAVVTGASSGIGREIALRLASLGMKVALLGRNEARLRETADRMNTETLLLSGDLTRDEHLKNCIAETVDRFGCIDVLVNCAGMALSCPFEEITVEQYDKIMAINARAPFLMCRFALPHLKKSDCATIVNIGSVVSHIGYPLQAAYTASKHALLGMSKSLAKEVYKDGIRVHVIAPGGVDTEMIRIARPDLNTDGMISPEEIADAVEFLVTHRGNAVTDEIRLHRAGKEPFQ